MRCIKEGDASSKEDALIYSGLPSPLMQGCNRYICTVKAVEYTTRLRLFQDGAAMALLGKHLIVGTA